MDLYVVRHGQSEGNQDKFHAGWSPVPLTRLGRGQAAEAGRKLAGLHFDRVYSSDIVRARQTAELVFPGYEYVFDERIREVSCGSLTGRYIEECRRQLGEPYILARSQADYTQFGGENREMAARRAAAFMRDMEAAGRDGCSRIGVVSHAGIIRQMVVYALHCDITARIAVGNCSIIRMRWLKDSWRLCL